MQFVKKSLQEIMHNCQVSRSKKAIYDVCDHATRHMIFQEFYYEHQGHFTFFSDLKFESNQGI